MKKNYLYGIIYNRGGYMKNNKGFIATTLIYSFLLLFATLIVVIIGNYNYYRNTLNKYNKGVNDALNSKIDSKYVTLKNEIDNSGFEIVNSVWNTGGATYNRDTLKEGFYSLRFNSSNITTTSNAFNCQSGRYYYVSYYIFTNGNVGDGSGSIGLFNTYNGMIAGEAMRFIVINYDKDYNFNWKKRGYLERSSYTGSCQFRVNYRNYLPTLMNIDNIVITDVTDIINKVGWNTTNKAKILNIFNSATKSGRIDYFSNSMIYNTDDLISDLG